jgi:hypothetical protein
MRKMRRCEDRACGRWRSASLEVGGRRCAVGGLRLEATEVGIGNAECGMKKNGRWEKIEVEKVGR